MSLGELGDREVDLISMECGEEIVKVVERSKRF
jgi:hypothetical protein